TYVLVSAAEGKRVRRAMSEHAKRWPLHHSKTEQGRIPMRTTFDRLFVAHPRSVSEDYLAHAGVALRFALILFGAALAALVHAVIPALFETGASSTIKKLHREMTERSRASQRR